MPLDNTIALITVDRYLLYSGETVNDPGAPNERIEQFINAASRHIITESGRKFVTPASAIVELFSGDGMGDYFAAHNPIGATPAPILEVYEGPTSGWKNVATVYNQVFAYSSDRGHVYFTDGNVFSRGERNYRLTYSYGWTLALMPQDIQSACCMIVDWLKLQADKLGVSSETFGDNSRNYAQDGAHGFPDHVWGIIRRYRRHG